MDIGKSFAWILFLGIVAAAGSFRHHEAPGPAPSRSNPAVQMAESQQAPAATKVALDTTRAVATRAVAPAIK